MSEAQSIGLPKPMSMGRLARRNLRARPSRFVATMLAILVGTGFLAGALVLRDSLSSSLESNAVAQVRNVDAAVEPKQLDDGSGGRGSSGTRVTGVPMSLLATVQGAEGVAGAAGISVGAVEILTPAGAPGRAGSQGRLWIPVASLNPFTVTSGQAPTSSGQIAIDTDTASRLGLSVGSAVSLKTTSGKQEATVVGSTSFGDKASAEASGDIFVSQADAATYLSGGSEQYDAIYVAASPDSRGSVVASVQAAVGSSYDVIDTATLQADEAGAAGGLAEVLGTGLLAFAYLSLFVCLFIVYNTFSIIVAQRLREFALLRAIGADVRQIRRSVQFEALVVGIVGSAAGMLIGILLFLALLHFVPAFQGLSGGGAVTLKVSPIAVLVVMVSGTIISFLSAVVPSWRAGRTAPLAALQAVSIDTSASNRFRAVVGPGLIVVGGALLVLGVAIGQLLVGVAGPALLFLGVLIGGPRLAYWFTTAAGFVVRPLARRVGPLAIGNVRRNPNRTATTANALVIGVFLVVFVTAAGGALRDYSSEQLGQLAGPDLTVISVSGPLPADLTGQISTTPGVTGTAAVYLQVGQAVFGEGPVPVAATDTTKLDVLGFQASSGSLDDLGPNEVVVWSIIADSLKIGVGSPLTISMVNGVQVSATVGALVAPVLIVPPLVMSQSTALAANPDLEAQQLAVQVQPGQVPQVQQAIETSVASYTSISVLPGNIFGQVIKSIFTALIQSVNALLGVAVVIALFGIVNTLILSVTERTREIGVLRAVGMTRAQLRATIRIEAVIVALLGTTIGMAFGMFVAYMVTRPMYEDSTGSFSWPVQEMALIALLGVVLGVVASLVPAWRAGRLDILDAISSE